MPIKKKYNKHKNSQYKFIVTDVLVNKFISLCNSVIDKTIIVNSVGEFVRYLNLEKSAIELICNDNIILIKLYEKAKNQIYINYKHFQYELKKLKQSGKKINCFGLKINIGNRYRDCKIYDSVCFNEAVQLNWNYFSCPINCSRYIKI